MMERTVGDIPVALVLVILASLLCLLPAVDALSSRRAFRRVAYALLFISIASASYANLDPWSHPWLFDYWTYMGWIGY